MLESMDKEKAKNKSPTIMRGLKERNHRLGACEKNFEEGYGKKEKKKRESWNCQHLKASQRLRKENAYQV